MKTNLYLLLFVLVLSPNVFSQWYWQNPSQQGNRINDFQFVDSLIGYACGYGGMILKTTNGGSSWHSLNSPTNNFIYDIFFLDSNTGWISDYNTREIFKTTAGGSNWNLVSIPEAGPIADFWFFNDSNGFGAGYSQFLKTTDGGLTWSNTGAGGGIYSIYFINESTGFIAGQPGLKKTTNGGQSWVALSIGNLIDFTPTAVYAFDAQNLYVIGQGWDFYGNPYYAFASSANGGYTWVSTQLSKYPSDLYFQTSSKGWICSENILKTEDRGLTWIDTNIPADYLEGKGSNNWCTYYNIISYSPDEWTTIIPQIESVFTGFLWDGTAKDTLTVYACGSEYTIIGSNDGGLTWSKLYSETEGSYLNKIIVDSSTLWAVGADGIILKSTDNGTSWRKMFIDGSTWLNDITFIGSGMGFAGGVYDGDGALFHTSDNGDSWGIFKLFPGEDDVVEIKFSDPNLGWLTTLYNIYRSTDGGKQWELVRPLYFSHFDVSGDTAWFISSNKIYRTTDAGYSFTTDTVFQYGQISFSDVNVDFTDALTGFVTAGDSRVFKSTDGGLTWSDMNFPAGVELFAQSFINAHKGWIFGVHGTIIKYDPYFTDVNDIGQEGPYAYFLSYNYPNPFNPSTSINYSIPEYSAVIIKVFDILGNEIATIVNEEKPAGTYEVTWNAAGLPSGVYFYQLRAEDYVQTKKMILMK